MATLCAVFAGKAQTEVPDTITVIENASVISVCTNGNSTTISATTTREDGSQEVYRYTTEIDNSPEGNPESSLNIDLPFVGCKWCDNETRRNGTNMAVTGLKGIYWGWNFNYNDKSELKNCFEVGVMELIGVRWRKRYNGPEFNIGLGFGMRRYLGGKGTMFGRDGNELIFVTADEGVMVTRARMDIWTFHVPVTYTQPIGKSVRLVVGGLVNFNTYAKAWNRVEDGTLTYSQTLKGFEQRLLTADVVGAICIRNGVGVYARWSPVPAFCSDKGPSVKSWSLGACIGF